MRSVTVIVLHAYLAMAPAKELPADAMDKLVDKLVEKLIDHVINTPLRNADLDKSTLALQSALTSGVAPMMAPRVSPMASSRAVTLFGPAHPASNQPMVSMNAITSGGQSQAWMPAPTKPFTSGGGMAQVYAMQDALKAYGVPPSPMGKLALTSLVATRDPSMKAQVREVFNSLPLSLQARVKKLNNDVIARAEPTITDYTGEWLEPGDIRSLENLKKKNEPLSYKNVQGADDIWEMDRELGESKAILATMAGKTEPLGGGPGGAWDPLGLAVDIPAGRLYYYREAELKNGRTAMMAVVGIITTENFRPFWDQVHGKTPWVSGAQSHWASEALDGSFWPALFLFAGAFELGTYSSSRPQDGKLPGDYSFDPLNIRPKNDDAWLEMQNKEINNGRLAMIAVIGIIGKELMTGEKVF